MLTKEQLLDQIQAIKNNYPYMDQARKQQLNNITNSIKSRQLIFANQYYNQSQQIYNQISIPNKLVKNQISSSDQHKLQQLTPQKQNRVTFSNLNDNHSDYFCQDFRTPNPQLDIQSQTTNQNWNNHEWVNNYHQMEPQNKETIIEENNINSTSQVMRKQKTIDLDEFQSFDSQNLNQENLDFQRESKPNENSQAIHQYQQQYKSQNQHSHNSSDDIQQELICQPYKFDTKFDTKFDDQDSLEDYQPQYLKQPGQDQNNNFQSQGRRNNSKMANQHQSTKNKAFTLNSQERTQEDNQSEQYFPEKVYNFRNRQQTVPDVQDRTTEQSNKFESVALPKIFDVNAKFSFEEQQKFEQSSAKQSISSNYFQLNQDKQSSRGNTDKFAQFLDNFPQKQESLQNQQFQEKEGTYDQQYSSKSHQKLNQMSNQIDYKSQNQFLLPQSGYMKADSLQKNQNSENSIKKTEISSQKGNFEIRNFSNYENNDFDIHPKGLNMSKDQFNQEQQQSVNSLSGNSQFKINNQSNQFVRQQNNQALFLEGTQMTNNQYMENFTNMQPQASKENMKIPSNQQVLYTDPSFIPQSTINKESESITKLVPPSASQTPQFTPNQTLSVPTNLPLPPQNLPPPPSTNLPPPPTTNLPPPPSTNLPPPPTTNLPPPPTTNLPPPPSTNLLPPPPPSKLPSPPPPPPPSNLPPPPPPPGKMGAPPPPPPPGAKIPPPPGSQPGKEKHKPNIQLRQVNWTVLKPDQVKNTIWEQIDDTKLKIDFGEIEQNFAVKPINQPASQTENMQKPIKQTRLTPERLKNVELILGKLKMPNQLIVDSLYSMNEDVLKPNIVESLCNAMPQSTEVGLWGDDIDQSTLQAPDIFCIYIGKVKGYDNRLLALRFKNQFHDLADDIVLKVQIFSKLIKKTKEDENIKIIMEYALAAGNYMNGQSARGGAYGFKFDMMEKLAEVKTTDNKRNLLMFIIEKCESDLGKEVVDVTEINDDIELAAKTPLNQLTIDLNEIKKNTKIVEKAFKSQQQPPIEDNVTEKLQQFYEECQGQIGRWEIELKQIEESFESLATYFAEQKVPFDKFFEKLLKFKNTCKQGKQKIIQIKKAEEKAQMQKEAASQKNKSQQHNYSQIHQRKSEKQRKRESSKNRNSIKKE